MNEQSFQFPDSIEGEDESVAWALSTAASLYHRGDIVGAIKWLRRAAEAANENDEDARAFRLYRAAAELADQSKQAPVDHGGIGSEATQPRMYAIDVNKADTEAPTDPAGALAYQTAKKTAGSYGVGHAVVGHAEIGDEITLVPFTKKAAGQAPSRSPNEDEDTMASLPRAAELALKRDDTMTSATTFPVLVLASGEDGAPRIVRLTAMSPAPEGAAAAVLVPNSAADAELVRQLLGSK